MNGVCSLDLGRGYLLKTTTIEGKAVYWVENVYFTSGSYHSLEDLVSFLHTLTLLPDSEDTLTWINLIKALATQPEGAIAVGCRVAPALVRS